MKIASRLILPAALGSIALAALGQAPAPKSAPAKSDVDYVSPNIGGVSYLLTSTIPYVQLPHGMARLAPTTTPGTTDRYLADKIYGFPAGPALLMVSTGDADTRQQTYASDYDHDFETATPYYFKTDLQSWNSRAEFTAAKQAAYYRFTLPASAHAHIVLSFARRGAEINVLGDKAIEGSARADGTVTHLDQAETREYFYAEFSKPLGSWQTWQNGQMGHDSKVSGDGIGFVTDNASTKGETIEVRVGISYISTEQAHKNLTRDIPAWSFDETKNKARAAWVKALGGIETVGGTERQRTIFYTALYRSLGRMTDVTEDGQYYSGYDHAVHSADGHDFYVDDGLWDTFRSLHPLQMILDPQQQEDMVRSYIRMAQQVGWVPSFPSIAGDQAVMIGHHAVSFILDAYAKGYRDFDVNAAYDELRKTLTQRTIIPWAHGPLTDIDRTYFDKGFFPALAWGEKEYVPQVTVERRQSVSVTLENSYDDWCMAQLAKALGKTDDEAYFTKLAHNYQNVYNPAIGFMAPRSQDGAWVANFDPKLGGHNGGRDYTTEVNSWLYTFSVQHDVAGLAKLMGGRDAFNARLDRLFAEQYSTSKFSFLGQFPDATGLVGQYAQGNEPSFHIPYMYDFTGQPWKTQKRVRQLMDVWYTDLPMGIPGDDDGGATSSWYVLSAIGFYPECPGSPVYELGSPIFAKTTIRVANGKQFTIVANHVSAQNKYIQSAQLNGKPLDHPWFSHKDLAGGGTLVLEMADHPNMKWGSAVEDAPPSMSSE